MSESIDLTIRDYNIWAMQLELSPIQKHHFRKCAHGSRRAILYQKADNDMNFEALCQMMLKEYDSHAQ